MSAPLSPAWTFRQVDYPVALAWSRTAELLAVAGADGNVGIAVATAGGPAAQVAAHTAPLTAVAWSPAEDVLATAGQDGAVRLIAPEGAARTVVKPGPVWTEHLAWHPRGKRLAAARGRHALLIDPASAAPPVRLGPVESTIAGLAWSPDGRKLAVACYGGVRLFDPVTGTVTRTLEWKGSMLGVAWRPDGKVVAGGCQDQTVHFWRLPRGADSAMSGYPAKPREVAWSPDGAWLATGGAAVLTLWPFDRKGPEGRAPLELDAHHELVTALAYAPLTPVLMSGDRGGRLVMWAPPERSEPLATTRLPDRVTAIAWGAAPAAGTVRWAAASADGTVLGGAL